MDGPRRLQTTKPVDAMVPPPLRLSARISKRDSKHRGYYRVRQIGRSGLLLASNGTFDAKLTAGDAVEMTVSWAQGNARCFGLVVHVTQADPARAYHVMTVEFTAGAELDQLLEQCELDVRQLCSAIALS